jgi:outer membrane protein assembly factor BamD (BamD/ComL family)
VSHKTEQPTVEHKPEAQKVHKKVVKRFPDSQFAEVAKENLNQNRQDELRKVVTDS